MNANKLRSKMVLYGDSVQDLASYLRISTQTLYNKMSDDGTEFKQNEITMIKIRYNLTAEEIDDIFFTA